MSIHSSPSSTKLVDREARALDDVARGAPTGHQVKCRPGNRSSAFSCWRSEVTCTWSAPPSGERPVDVGERHRQLLGRDVHVRLVRPRCRRAHPCGTAACSRSATTRPRVGRECAATWSTIATAASNATTGVPRSPLCQPGPQPTSAGARRAGPARERVERGRHGPAAVLDPVVDVRVRRR